MANRFEGQGHKMTDADQTTDAQDESLHEDADACEVDFAAGPITASDAAPVPGGRDVLLYISPWCGDCRRAVDFLDQHEIRYRSIDITVDEDAALVVESFNRGYRSTPTILIDGMHVATEPSRAQLAALFDVSDDSGSYSPLSLLRRR